MNATHHPFSELFAQLGLPADERAIHAFIAHHGPLQAGTALHEAPFWSPAQALMLHELLLADADWAGVVEDLNAALH